MVFLLAETALPATLGTTDFLGDLISSLVFGWDFTCDVPTWL